LTAKLHLGNRMGGSFKVNDLFIWRGCYKSSYQLSRGEMKPMTRPGKKALQAVPLFQHESLLLGMDVGKTRHVAGFVSTTLLERHQRFEACPALAFEKSREGFQALVERMRELAPLEQYTVLLEKTGHYHKALQPSLQELELPV
jgi:hypothetical protein